jgi:predicted metal-dependent hydrolase
MTLPLPKNFQYALRVSRRVRGVKIAVKPFQGLEVIVPPRFPKRQIAGILQQHAGWINRQLQKHQHSFEPPTLPQQLSLTLIGQTQPIRYHPADRARMRESGGILQLEYATTAQAIKLLRGQVRKQARQILTPMLQDVADNFGFHFKKISIRSQKTRWGSCSSSGTISLNDQLIFLPPDTVKYLLIHELCHTRHMNHSQAFWGLVQQCCADYRHHDQLLSTARSHVPDWFLHSVATSTRPRA